MPGILLQCYLSRLIVWLFTGRVKKRGGYMKKKFNVTITFKNVLRCLKMIVKKWHESRSKRTRPPTSDMLHLSMQSLQLEDTKAHSQHHCLHVWLMLHKISQGYREAQLLRRLECATWKWICSQMWTSNHLRILFFLHLAMWTVPFGSNEYTSTHLPSNCKVKNHSLTMQCLSSRWKGRGYMQFLLLTLSHFCSRCIKAQTKIVL